MSIPITPYKIKKGILYWKHFGTREFFNHLLDRMEPEEVPYDVWFEQHRAKEDVLRRQIKNPPAGGPLISVIVPAYNTPEAYLMEMVQSVIAQSYEKWELLIVDAGASAAESAKMKKKKRKERSVAEVTKAFQETEGDS